jgi:malic enzyme
VEETIVEGGKPMTSQNPDAPHTGEGNLFPEPESMQKYSDEVRERIAKKAFELYERRGREAERDVEDWLKAEELVRKEMTEDQVPPSRNRKSGDV